MSGIRLTADEAIEPTFGIDGIDPISEPRPAGNRLFSADASPPSMDANELAFKPPLAAFWPSRPNTIGAAMPSRPSADDAFNPEAEAMALVTADWLPPSAKPMNFLANSPTAPEAPPDAKPARLPRMPLAPAPVTMEKIWLMKPESVDLPATEARMAPAAVFKPSLTLPSGSPRRDAREPIICGPARDMRESSRELAMRKGFSLWAYSRGIS